MPETTYAFTMDEYRGRLARLRERMRERGVDVVLVDETEIMAYYTGYAISENMYRAALIPLEGEPMVVLRALDEAPFLASSWVSDYRTFFDTEDPVQAVGKAIAERWGTAAIGVDFNSYAMPVGRFRKLEGLVPGARFVDFSGILWQQRLRKSEQEIAYLRRASGIADEAMRRAIAASGVGKSERDAAAAAAHAFLSLGADSGKTGPITSGTGWNFLHGATHDRPLEAGEVLHLELVPRYKGYSARLMRPAVMGQASNRQREVAETIVRLQDAQFAAMKAGTVARDADAILRKGMIHAGLRDAYDNNTGYTLGYYFEGAPRTSDFTRVVNPNADWPLEAGMVFHMYTSAESMAFSETVLVTDAGGERLTRIERKLFEA